LRMGGWKDSRDSVAGTGRRQDHVEIVRRELAPALFVSVRQNLEAVFGYYFFLFFADHCDGGVFGSQ
jgi:hypothetical protein